MIDPSATSGSIAATLGNVHESQVAIGDHILQVNARDGAVVKLVTPRRRVRPRPRPRPVLLRPRQATGFLDRSIETETALAALRTGATVEVVGDAGIGKTTLLRRLSHAVMEGVLPDGVVHLVAAGRPLADVLQLIHGQFFAAPGHYRAPEPELRHALQELRALIVLDDVELGREELGRLLDAVPRSAVLLAAQSRRSWGESQVIPLGGLPPGDAAALIERELGRALDPQERAVAAALSTRLSGHPLLLLQAAAQARDAGRPLAEATTAAGTVPEPDSKQRAVLLLLAAAGELDTEALITLAGPDAEPAVEALLALHLADARDGVIRSLPGVERGFSEDELKEPRRRVIAFLVPWAEARRYDSAAIGARAPLLLRAVRAAHAMGDAASALRLARAIEPAFMLLGLWGSWRLLLEACASAGRAVGDSGAIEAWTLHQLGVLELASGDTAGAARHLEAALHIREALGDTAGAAVTRANLRALRVVPGPFAELREWVASGAAGKVAGGVGIVLLGGAALVWQFGFRTPESRLVAGTDYVDFAQQDVGSMSTAREIRVTNESRGLVRMEPARLDGDDFRITADGCAGLLAGQSTCAIAAVFVPAAAGPRTARLQLRGTPARAMPPIVLAGYGTGPDVIIDSLSPPPPDTTRLDEPADRPAIDAQHVDFGEREAGSSTIGTGTLSNTGTAEARFGRIDLSGDPDFRVLRDGCSGRTLAPRQTCVVEIEFRPTSGGARSATLSAPAQDGETLSILRVHGGGATPPPPPPAARILGFEIDAAALREERVLRLCYGVADAVEARIDPAPGGVPPLERECVSLRPAAGVYTLTALGADGNRVAERITVALPTARILRLTAAPDIIEPGASARICYALADAVSAELLPAPDEGTVMPQPRHCVAVTPTSTRNYTLRVRGLDGGGDERQVTVEVRAADRQPPPVPQRLVPGSASESSPQFPTTCPRVTAQWMPVEDASPPVAYEVVLQHGTARTQWRDIHRARVGTTTASFERPLTAVVSTGGEGTFPFRWTVRAVDAAGNEGEFAPSRYFSCIIIR
jgi:hypothetical protein